MQILYSYLTQYGFVFTRFKIDSINTNFGSFKSLSKEKLDESNDEEFYSDPKFVYHLDANFRQYLSGIYNNEIADSSTVLDLMSSWDSYLPKGKNTKKLLAMD